MDLHCARADAAAKEQQVRAHLDYVTQPCDVGVGRMTIYNLTIYNFAI